MRNPTRIAATIPPIAPEEIPPAEDVADVVEGAVGDAV